jgi:DNA polymerase epsilon subunit 1
VGKAGNTSYGPRKPKTVEVSSLRGTEGTSQNEKLESTRLANRIDESMGFTRFESGKRKVGWLVNMHSTTIEDENVPGGKAGVDYYFIGEDGDTFKATLEYDPYFLLAVKKGRESEVEEYCKRAFEGLVKTMKKVEKEDLSMPNHLTGYRRTFLQLSFANVNDLLAVRKAVGPIVEKNKKNVNAMDTYAEVAT